MGLRLEIVSDHRRLVGDDAVRDFGENGGTIGRSLQNDWILPDPDRFISGRHATIDFKGGIYYLLDTSSNGVYVNGDCEPVGKGNSRRLFNGDQLRLGDFEISVAIDSGESIEMPLDATDANPIVHAHSLVDHDPGRTGIQLLDEDALTGDSEFQSTLFGGNVDTGIAKAAESKVRDIAPVRSAGRGPGKKSSAAVTDEDLGARVLFDAFLEGAGLDRAEFHSAVDITVAMNNAGKVLREFVDGVNRLLVSRANLKSAFRLDQTTVLPRHNNPLKLSTNSRDSVTQLLVGQEGEYLGPRDAVQEVCRDLLFHQEALLDAMASAFLEFADRFDPDELEEDFNRTLGSNPLKRPFRKSKYWPLYRDLYPILTAKGDGRFPQMFSEEFVKAYEHEIADYRRGGATGLFKETVVLDANRLKPVPAAPVESAKEPPAPLAQAPATDSGDAIDVGDALDFDVGLPDDEVVAALSASSNDDTLPAEDLAGDETSNLAKG